NAGVGIRAAHKRESHSPGQVDVIDVAALPQQHAWVLDPPYLCADHFARTNETGCHSSSRRSGIGESGNGGIGDFFSGSPVHPFISLAAVITARTMFAYPVQRQRLPESP